MKKRKAEVKRTTRETDIKVAISLEGKGRSSLATGVGFLDHMLELFSHHGLFDLKVKTGRCDLEVDIHHTNEDVGIALGRAVKKALGNKRGIRRIATSFVPMDEALASVRVVLDISGRPSLYFKKGEASLWRKTNGYCLNDALEFLRAFSQNSGITLHVDILRGRDPHHIIEALFKALGRSLRAAAEVDRRRKGIPSTKGKL